LSEQEAAAPAPETAAEPKAPEPDFYAQLLSLKAEFENFRKRTDREKPEYFRMGRAEVMLKLLPIYDMLLQAHQQIAKEQAESQLSKGMELIFKEFEKIFKEEGVTAMEPAGKPYDPLKHEVLGAVEQAGVEDGTVVDVFQNGFMMGEKVLRTAKVRIAKKTS
jgi:molecular chaperone GrpE